MMRSLPLPILFLALPLAAQDHDLKINVPKGAAMVIVRTSDQSQMIDMGGQEFEQKTAMKIATQVTVRDVDAEGNLTVEAKVLRVSGGFTIPMMGDFAFDSIDMKAGDDKPADGGGADEFGPPDFDAIGKAAASFAGTTYTAMLDGYGKVTKLEGADKAIDDLRKRAGGQGGQMLSSTFSEKSLEDIVRSAFGERPSKPTAIGATWERDDSKSEKDGTPTATKITLKLARVTDKAFEVEGEGIITKPEAPKDEKKDGEDDESAAMMREMMSKMKIENGKVKGKTLVSREDGFVVEATSETTMDVKMPGPMGDMSIKVHALVGTKRTTEAEAMAHAAKGDAKADATKGGDK